MGAFSVYFDDDRWQEGRRTVGGSKELSADVVCRVKYGEWVKRIVGGVWSVGSSMASGSKELSAGVVCRRENGEWVKRPVGGCGLSGQVCCVGQEACWRRVACRRENVEWVKGIVAGVWSVGVKRASGSRGLSLAFGLSARKRRVNQRNHTYRMPQTLQIATQIKIAKTLKT